jgi:hypothetical protein
VVKDGTIHVQAGAGIVADSDPAYEQRECEAKAGAMLAAARGMRSRGRATGVSAVGQLRAGARRGSGTSIAANARNWGGSIFRIASSSLAPRRGERVADWPCVAKA